MSVDQPLTKLSSPEASTIDQPGDHPQTDTDRLHQQIIDLRRDGLSQRLIAERLGVAKTTVHWHLRKHVRDVAKDLDLRSVTREEIQQKIYAFAPAAAEKVMKLAQKAKKEEVQLKASTDLLDRAGFAPAQKQVIYHIYDEMPRDQLVAEIKSLLRGAGSGAGSGVDNMGALSDPNMGGESTNPTEPPPA